MDNKEETVKLIDDAFDIHSGNFSELTENSILIDKLIFSVGFAEGVNYATKKLIEQKETTNV